MDGDIAVVRRRLDVQRQPVRPRGSLPGDSTISGEGADLGASQSVSDKADNSNSFTVSGIHIDRTPPTTSFSSSSDWTNQGVTISLLAVDNLSGVAATHYRVDGGAAQTGGSIVIDTQGVHQLEIWSVDRAGNVEAHQAATVRIDKTAPTINHTLSPPPNLALVEQHRCHCDVHVCGSGGVVGLASCSDPSTSPTKARDRPSPVTPRTSQATQRVTRPRSASTGPSPPSRVLRTERRTRTAGTTPTSP